MKVLVTGASGFVGYHVAKELIEKGCNVKVLVRETPEHLKKLSVEFCKGDLRDKASLKEALEGCQQLYHVAAFYKLWSKDPKIFYDINVEGTRKLFQAASEEEVSKIVYTSSVAAIKLSSKGISSDENCHATLDDMVGHYKRSKFLSEMVANEFVQEGLPIVIVNPSTPIGPFDIKPTPTGQIILDFLKRKMPAYMDTGLNLVAVEDVAKGHLLACEKGKVGERYILGDENLKLIEIFKILQDITKLKAPKVRIPYFVGYMSGFVSELFAKITHSEPSIPLDGVKMAKKYMFFDASKAKKELGFEPTPVKYALERAVRWFYDNGYVN